MIVRVQIVNGAPNLLTINYILKWNLKLKKLMQFLTFSRALSAYLPANKLVHARI